VDDRLREQLIGYALGALDDAEQLEIEQRLTADPQLRRDLEVVQKSLEPLADAYVEHDPPPGLAAKACSYVASEAERLQVVQPGRLSGSVSLETRSRWALADWLVVGGICASAVLLFFPAVLNSRFLSRVTMCQDNLRHLGTSLIRYSEYVGNGAFPAVETEGNRSFAGIYGPKLAECGLLPDNRRVICPDSELAAKTEFFRIPTVAEIDEARGRQILILQRLAGGSYAYSLGVILNGQHRAVKNLGRAHFAIMADSPRNSLSQPAHQHGQNILYEDLHITFVANGPNVKLVDDPFCNRFGRCEAGVDINDAVVAPSDCPPIRTNAILNVFH
jgi:hypothetical protein